MKNKTLEAKNADLQLCASVLGRRNRSSAGQVGVAKADETSGEPAPSLVSIVQKLGRQHQLFWCVQSRPVREGESTKLGLGQVQNQVFNCRESEKQSYSRALCSRSSRIPRLNVIGDEIRVFGHIFCQRGMSSIISFGFDLFMDFCLRSSVMP